MEHRVAVYVRVSTKDQRTDSQLQEIENFVKARNWRVHFLFEEKLSGTTAKRPEFQRMLAAARSRQFDVLVVAKLDRLCRSLRDLVTTLQEMSDLGISFISLRDQIDATTSSGRLMLHLLGAFAEFEASLIRERVMSGLDAAKRRGQRLGRPPTVDRRRVAELRRDGRSLSEIATTLGISKAAVSKTLSVLPLKNPVELSGTVGIEKPISSVSKTEVK